MMTEETRKFDITAILARLDKLVEQTQSLQADIKKKMMQQRSDHHSVAQALGSRAPVKPQG
jgi:hypothetical protein